MGRSASSKRGKQVPLGHSWSLELAPSLGLRQLFVSWHFLQSPPTSYPCVPKPLCSHSNLIYNAVQPIATTAIQNMTWSQYVQYQCFQHNQRSTTLKIEQMELFNKVSFASFCSPQQSDELSFITFQHHLVLFSENTSRTTAPGVIWTDNNLEAVFT